MTITVLQAVLGGALSAGAATPGAGARTRLAGWLSGDIESAVAFHEPFSDSGIFGIYASGAATAGARIPEMVAAEAKKLSQVSAAELDAAKCQVKTSVTAGLEDPQACVEDMGRQVLMMGRTMSADELCAMVDKVTAADVSKAASAIFATAPTVVSYGDCSCAPHYSDVVKLFGK